jgi:hypothetical protein
MWLSDRIDGAIERAERVGWVEPCEPIMGPALVERLMMGFTAFNPSYGPRDGLGRMQRVGRAKRNVPALEVRVGTARIARLCTTLRVNNIGRI